MSDQYERYHQRALNSLKALKTWKNLRAGSEFGGLALAFGTYLLTPNFWAFLSVAIAIAAVYFLLQARCLSHDKGSCHIGTETVNGASKIA